MSFLNQIKFKEIKQAAFDGNEKAKIVLQALRKGCSQEDLDYLTEQYYRVDTVNPLAEEQAVETLIEPNESAAEEEEPILDISEVLDKDLDGVLDENEIEDISFFDFLKNKTKDKNRSKKNVDYFKIYDSNAKGEYLKNKVDGYKTKFNGKIKKIDKNYNDISRSIQKYLKDSSLALDDNVELDSNKVEGAYNDFIGNENAMSSFGRYWDDDDDNNILEALKELMVKYGKNNVVSAINVLNNDNEGYRQYLNNQVDTEINRYSKSLENLLK